MGRGLEVVTGRVTAPGAVLTTLTANTGNSFVIRGTDPSKKVWLITLWAANQVAGTLRITSPRLHDQVQGIRERVTAAATLPLLNGPGDRAFRQILYPQDGLTVQLSGSGVAGQIEEASLLIYYEDLQGISARLVDSDTVLKNGINMVTAEVTVVSVATGDYGGAVAINSSFDNLIANTDYAIMGGLTDTRGTTVRMQGVDLGNLGIGFPAEPSIRDVTNSWFYRISESAQMPLIPVINSANKAGISIDVATNQAGGTFIIDFILVQLAPGVVPPGGVAPPAR